MQRGRAFTSYLTFLLAVNNEARLGNIYTYIIWLACLLFSFKLGKKKIHLWIPQMGQKFPTLNPKAFDRAWQKHCAWTLLGNGRTHSMSHIIVFFFFFFLGIIKYDDILYDHLQNTGQSRQQEKRVLPTTVCKTAKINVLIFVHSIFKTLFWVQEATQYSLMCDAKNRCLTSGAKCSADEICPPNCSSLENKRMS